MSKNTKNNFQKLKYGMVGGGEGAFIGSVHRKAIALDGKAELVAGCFSRDYQKTLKKGRSLGLNEDRLYNSYVEMAKSEKERTDCIDFVVIVTPNISHFEIAKSFLECGINVVCDKPLVTQSHEAILLTELVEKKNVLFCVTYTYMGYPIIKHVRELISKGLIGRIRFINAEYAQDWLAVPLEQEGVKQAVWRTDPAQAGLSSCVGDIGSHIENIITYVTGLKIERVCARLDIFGENRALDDNATILIDYSNGAKGVFWCSQIAVGHNNDLRIRIFGTNGSIEWHQEKPDELKISYKDKPTETFIRGRDALYPLANFHSRLPAGHPEGYFEAFANIYASFCNTIQKMKSGESLNEIDYDYPSIQDGTLGVVFIEKCVESSLKGSVWVDVH